MYMAKNHSEAIAQEANTHRLCYAGTIVGVVLALCTVGKFLFSQNLAIFLNYCTRGSGTLAWNDIILTLLLVSANMIIYKPVKAEFKETWLYKRCTRSNDEVDLNLVMAEGDTRLDRVSSGMLASGMTTSTNQVPIPQID